MRKVLRRVRVDAAVVKPAGRVIGTDVALGIFHHDGGGLVPAAQLRHKRRTPVVVIILDLAIETLKALGRHDLSGGRDRPYRTGAFA